MPVQGKSIQAGLVDPSVIANGGTDGSGSALTG
jgi:hypothetical protein